MDTDVDDLIDIDMEYDYKYEPTTTVSNLDLLAKTYASQEKYAEASIATLTICALGLIGNLLSLIVLLNGRMRSSGHVSLLIGLTICDAIVLIIGIINTTEHLGLHSSLKGPFMKVIRFILSWIGSGGTRYFIVAISIERFVAIFYPYKANSWTTVSNERKATGVIFIFLIILAILSHFVKGNVEKKQYNMYSAVILNFLPFSAVIVFNTATLIKAREYARVRNALRKMPEDQKNEKVKEQISSNKQSRSVTRMLVTVIVVFVICYSFETVRRIAHFIWPEYYENGSWLSFRINLLSDIFYVLNSSVNFIVYLLLGKKFRNTFKLVLRETFSPCLNSKTQNGIRSEGKSTSQTNA